MKQLFMCLIFLIFITYINSSCYAIGDGENVKKDECLKRKVGNESGPAGHTADTCCLFETSGKLNGVKETSSFCGAYEKSKVPDYMKTYEKAQEAYKKASEALGVTDIKYSLDCSSSYIKFGFIVLFLILF